MNSIPCPHCGKTVEISEAFKHQFEENALIEVNAKHAKELEETKKLAEEKAIKKATEELSLKMQDKENEALEARERLKKLQEELLDMTKMMREMREKDEQRELTMQRKLAEERNKIQEEVGKVIQEKANFEILELKKQNEDMKKALEEAQRKGAQKSQQLQGEVMELEIENMLRMNFPHDEILPVAKGVTGADICQIVKSPRGFICGKILWEFKRTQAWSDKWISKLKEDMRVEKADIAVIVSLDLPLDAKDGIGNKDGIVIIGHDYIIPVAVMLRKNLLDVGYERVKSINKEGKAEEIFSYVTSRDFQQQIENIVEAYRETHSQIIKERTAFEKIWKQREVQAQRIITSTANIFGTLQGKAGASMPQIKGLELLEEGDEQLNLIDS